MPVSIRNIVACVKHAENKKRPSSEASRERYEYECIKSDGKFMLVLAIPERFNINNKINNWPSNTPIFIVLAYYTGNMFRL